MRIVFMLAVFATLVSGCSWFGGDDDEVRPAELTRIDAEVQLHKVWDRKLGPGANDRASQLIPAIAGSRVFAASASGKIMAMEVDSGRVIWEKHLRDFYPDEDRATAFGEKSDLITGGVGAGGDLLVVGSFAGEIVAMNQSDGSLVFRARTTSEVLAPPQVDRDIVIAQSIDGKVTAFDALDGTRRWIYSTSVPSLTLRGTSTPILESDVVIVGFSNGRIAVLDRKRGLAGIDRRVAASQGKSDLERLVDIDGRMVLIPPNLYVASYQGNLASIDLTSGNENWNMPASSTVGLGEGFGNIYLAHADGKLSAINPQRGSLVWEIDGLKHRQLTTPVTLRSYIAVGDFEGYVHLIAQSDGRFVGRERVARDALRAPFVIDGSRVYVQSSDGRLATYELR
ncbi:MAG: outer membrane protein assembly factor BamB [Pseudomonadales bacterium]